MPSAGRKRIGRLVKWAIWLGFVLVPVMAMGNCSGWNEGSMAVASCAIDTPFLRELANFYYGYLLLSAFTLGVPIFIYLAVGFFAGRVANRLIAGKA